MHAREENTTMRKLKRGIKNVRRKIPNPSEVLNASKTFFGVTENTFRAKERFTTDLGKISKSEKNKMSTIFGQADLSFMQLIKEEEDHETLNELEEFPVSVDVLYNNQAITDGQLGKGIKVTLDFETKKVRRNIDTVDEVEIEEGEGEKLHEDYRKLHEDLKVIENKYKKSADEIAEIFVKVSGDIQNLERYFQGENVLLWTYLEDLALTKSEDSMEYKCLLESKGKVEIEKRKNFLLKSDQEG